MTTYGNYEVAPMTVKSIIDPNNNEVAKSGRRKASAQIKKSFPIIVHYVYVRDKRSNQLFRFTGVKRQGVIKFSDGRRDVYDLGGKDESRMTDTQLVTTLNKMLGADNGQVVVDRMFANVVKGKEVRELLNEWNAEIDKSIQHVKAIRANAKQFAM